MFACNEEGGDMVMIEFFVERLNDQRLTKFCKQILYFITIFFYCYFTRLCKLKLLTYFDEVLPNFFVFIVVIKAVYVRIQTSFCCFWQLINFVLCLVV